MARIRTIKPDFWTDEKIVDLSPMARLLFIGLWNFSDDEGRMQYSIRKIKMQIFPADNADLLREVGEIRGAGLICIYNVDSVEYLQIVNFEKHQKIDKRLRSKFPPNPDSPRLTPIHPDGREGKGREGKGREGKGNGRDITSKPENYTTEYSREKNGENFENSEYSYNPDDEVQL